MPGTPLPNFQPSRFSSGGVSIPLVPFGGGTLSGAGGFQLKTGSTSLTNVTDAGTGSASGYSLSSGGVVTPSSNASLSAQDGATLDVSSDQGSFTFTFAIEADCLHVASGAEARTASIDTSVRPAGGKTIRIRDGSDATLSSRICKPYSYTAEVLFAQDPGATLTGEWAFEKTSNVRVAGLHIHNTSALYAQNCIRIIGDLHDFTIEDCELHGTYYDPLGDYSDGSYANCNGIKSQTATVDPYNVTIRRNKIYDVYEGLNLLLDGAGDISITDNEIYHMYSDGMKITLEGDALTASKDCSRNVLYNSLGDPNDPDNPHVDFMQFLATATNTGVDCTNMTLHQNVIFHDPSAARGTGSQGIFATDGAHANGIVAKDWSVKGNVIIVDAQNALLISDVDGGDFVNNTVIRRNATDTETGICGVELGSISSAGTINITRNLTDGNTLEGSATYTQTDNISVGDRGATYSYADTLVDASTPASFAEVLSKKARKTGGQADLAGGPPDAGALGSSAATFGAVRNSSGWSVLV